MIAFWVLEPLLISAFLFLVLVLSLMMAGSGFLTRFRPTLIQVWRAPGRLAGFARRRPFTVGLLFGLAATTAGLPFFLSLFIAADSPSLLYAAVPLLAAIALVGIGASMVMLWGGFFVTGAALVFLMRRLGPNKLGRLLESLAVVVIGLAAYYRAADFGVPQAFHDQVGPILDTSAVVLGCIGGGFSLLAELPERIQRVLFEIATS
jgi:hypothetical protein